jgi:molybdopterin synthase sulfur carrier subunit
MHSPPRARTFHLRVRDLWIRDGWIRDGWIRDGRSVIVRLLLFAQAREAAGRNRDDYDLAAGASLDVLLAATIDRYGEAFARVLATSRVWVNGDEPVSGGATGLQSDDEIAILPPVSGGA